MINKSNRSHKKDIDIFIVILCIVISIILIAAIAGIGWNLVVENQAPNKVFMVGSLPKPELNGNYKGIWSNSVSWKGKEFDAKTNTGINLIDGGKKYSFVTSSSKSLHSNQEVLKLNYNVAGNPLWLKFIVDEIVETSPGKYQGKVYVQPIPGLAVTITYFMLEK